MPKSKSSTTLTPKALARMVNKEFGSGTVTMGSDPHLVIQRMPCSILSVDWLLGGGFALGRHSELYGEWSAGKTLVALRLIANAQKLDTNACYIDCEKTFDPKWAEHIGVNLDVLAYHRQRHGHEVVNFMETLLRSNLYSVIVLDSIAALLPKQELDKSMEPSSYGTQQAKLMSEALRRLTAANDKTALVYVNQTRESVSSVFKRRITSGGRAMGFYAGTRLELTKAEILKKKVRTIDPQTGNSKMGTKVVGHRARMRVEKDKVGGRKAGSEITFVFNYKMGKIDPIEDLLLMGRFLHHIHKKGNKWWVEGFDNEAQNGRAKFVRWLRTNKAVLEELKELVSKDIYE